MKMSTARSWITGIWIGGAFLFYLLIIVQSLRNKYDPDADKVWAWALPTMMPTLLLMIGVHAGEALSPNKEDRDITRFFFGLTLATSAFYILIVMLTILLAPFSSSAPLALMEKSNLWLGPLQGLAAGTFGVFYVHRKN